MSDQDFFFDEEDEKPARTEKTSAPKSAARRPSGGKAAPAAKAPARAAAPAPAGSFFEQTVNVGIVSMLVVIALLIGVIVGVFVGQARATDAALTSVPAVTNTGATSGGGSAPALTQDQMSSGQLPAGHPSVGASSSTNATGQ